MKARALNWPLWSGFLLTLFAFVSYMFIFVRFASTRDFPWANLLLFAAAAALVFVGLQRAFRRGTRGSRITGSIVAGLSLLTLVFFVFTIFVFARFLPSSKGAPQVGQRAPEFQLSDSNGNQVALSELRTAPINGKTPKGVLLVFYRGYW